MKKLQLQKSHVTNTFKQNRIYTYLYIYIFIININIIKIYICIHSNYF